MNKYDRGHDRSHGNGYPQPQRSVEFVEGDCAAKYKHRGDADQHVSVVGAHQPALHHQECENEAGQQEDRPSGPRSASPAPAPGQPKTTIPRVSVASTRCLSALDMPTGSNQRYPSAIARLDRQKMKFSADPIQALTTSTATADNAAVRDRNLATARALRLRRTTVTALQSRSAAVL